jgi:Na+-transporting NADH:ubiquinone oxidoreductase subunit NqrC
MAVVDELSDALARDVLQAQDELDNDRFYMDVAKVLSTLSPSMEEGFLTAIRVRLAERRGREFLDKRLAQFRASKSGG